MLPSTTLIYLIVQLQTKIGAHYITKRQKRKDAYN
jgi:hypothetical protein